MITKFKNKIQDKILIKDIGFKVSKNVSDFRGKYLVYFYSLKSKKMIFRFENDDVSATILDLFLSSISDISGRKKSDFSESTQGQMLSFDSTVDTEELVYAELIEIGKKSFFSNYMVEIYSVILLIGMIYLLIR